MLALAATLAGCTETYRVRPPRERRADTSACLRRCEAGLASWNEPDDRTRYHHCIASCPGMARVKGRCEGLAEPCAEVAGVDGGQVLRLVALVGAFAVLMTGALLIDELDEPNSSE